LSVHGRLVNEKQILHHDISVNNILLCRPPNHPNELPRKGVLIDMDYAAFLDRPTEPISSGHRTVITEHRLL